MESIIQSPGVQELFRQLRDEGRVEGRVEGRIVEARAALRRIIELRGFAIAEELERQIDDEDDLERLASWRDRAITAHSVDDIFAR